MSSVRLVGCSWGMLSVSKKTKQKQQQKPNCTFSSWESRIKWMTAIPPSAHSETLRLHSRVIIQWAENRLHHSSSYMLCGLLGWITAAVGAFHWTNKCCWCLHMYRGRWLQLLSDGYRDLMTRRHFELSAAVNCRTTLKIQPRLLFTIINSEWSHASQTVKTVMIAGLAQK